MWNTWTPVQCIVLVYLSMICSTCLAELHFCSVFNNRKPSPQPGLQNCTWYKNNSCCTQEEIDANVGVNTFAGSSPKCIRHTMYLNCYMCAPYQNIFYDQGRLTVCEEFCNDWYSACSSAILKGSVIGTLYKSGREFCKTQNFETEPMVKVGGELGRCFAVPSVDFVIRPVPNGSRTVPMSLTFLFCFALATHLSRGL